MKKNIFFVLLYFFISLSVNAQSSFKTTTQEQTKIPNLCQQHYPYGIPQINSQDKEKIARRSFFLCEENYAVQYDPASKTPIWVSEVIQGATEHPERIDDFQPHPLVPKPAQAKLNDYKGSKMDRGHMAPAADMKTPKAMEESFYLTNMVPQVGPNMNRGIWAELEDIARKWSQERQQIFVITGPLFLNKQKITIGNSEVNIPSHLYKIILDPKTMENIVFKIPNNQIITRKTRNIDEGNPNIPQTTPNQAINCGRTCTLDDFIISMSELETLTNINFFPNLSQTQKQNYPIKGRMWHIKKQHD